MSREMGVWIDQTQAVIVMEIKPDEPEEIMQVFSNIAKHIRYSSASHASVASEPSTAPLDGRDRHFDDLLNHYYDRVILNLKAAVSIVIIGPGEAKYALQKRLAVHGLDDSIVAVKTADQMTNRQITAEIRQHFETYNAARAERG
jgi:hypothetical protein